jgi:hypothetical protein
MNTNIVQDLSQIYNELSEKVCDTRAMLSAIQSKLFESTDSDSRAEEAANDIHSLVPIALERARQAVDLSAQIEGLLIALRRPAPSPHDDCAASSKADFIQMELSPRAAEFIANYDKCTEERKAFIERQLFRARNGLPIEHWEA